jgi:uncharacterized protein (DUF849 family)
MGSHKIIITCAVTAAIHTPSMSAHLPVSPEDIADAAIGAAEAGAAIVHLHARNAADGRPDQTPEAFAPFLKEIKRRSNVVVNLTTGGSPYMKAEERILPAKTFKPEVASLNMGSMNFGTIGKGRCSRIRATWCSAIRTRTLSMPLFVQTVFGILGGIGPHAEDVLHMKRTADRLFGSDYRWSVLGASRAQMPRCAIPIGSD